MTDTTNENTNKKDDLEQAIDRNTLMLDGIDFIETAVVKQLLDHFIPKWRKREDKYFKYKKFATEQQLDKNINELRSYVKKNTEQVYASVNQLREFMDEFESQAAEVKRIIQKDRIAMVKFRMLFEEETEP